MASSKEQCFKDALESYEDATGKKTGVETEQPWRQNTDGSWSREPRGFWAAVNSMKKWVMGDGHAGSVTQVRRPDLTINGNTVFDLKFTRADGTVDNWGTKPGQGNGNTQLNDYNEINKQNNPGLKNKDPKLDPKTCKCDQRGAKHQQVMVPSPYGAPGGIYVMPMAPLGGLPAMPGLPVFPGGLVPVPSSRTYKDDIAPADLRAERLLELDVKSFRWRKDGRPDIGLIAEEVQAVVPELYYKDAAFSGVQAGHLPFYLLDLIKAQQAKLDDLTAQVEALTEKLAKKDKA